MQYKYRYGYSVSKIITFLLCCAILVGVRLSECRSSKIIPVKSERQFDRAMRHAELAVIMFYKKDKRMSRSNKSIWRSMERLERMFANVGKSSRYREAGVRFILVNGVRGDLDDMFYNYRIKNIPTFMLFENGRPVKYEQERERVSEQDSERDSEKGSRRSLVARAPIVRLVGDITADRLRDFIEDHVGSRIDHIIEDRAEARRWAAENRLYAWPYWGFGVGAGPYYYWNYPYYGYYGPWWW